MRKKIVLMQKTKRSFHDISHKTAFRKTNHFQFIFIYYKKL